MSSIIASACCCGGKKCLSDCLIGSEVQHGCCHKEDTLLLWCERPTYSFRENYQFGATPPFGSNTHERCEITTYNEQEPVQAIYEYYDCFYRCIAVNALQPITNLAQLGTKCRDETCSPEDYDGPCSALNGCCDNDSSQNPACCECNVPWLSSWRRQKLAGYTANIDWCIPDTPDNVGYDEYKWLLETTCHKGGAVLAPATGSCCVIEGYSQCDRLLNQVIGIIHFERWWKIADCPEGVRIYVPGGLGAYQTDDLVPKWWIYACSGIPLYVGDLCDAVRFGVITVDEAVALIQQIQDPVTYGMPNQATLRKLGDAGYIAAKDWREEQRQAYIDLHARFPAAGYDAFIEPVENMHTLGPFRKRMTYATVGLSNLPLLRKADVTTTTNLDNLQADGFLSYPGSNVSQEDYDYWCQRQWVYFRARPGGWTWAGWQQGQGQAEIDSILLGNGRADQSCVDALTGNPRTDITCATCVPCDSGLIACGCGTCPEHTNPSARCSPNDYNTKEGLVATSCANITFTPVCEGLAIVSNTYEIQRQMVNPGGSGCQAQDTWTCLVETRNFLVEAKRSVDSWLDSVPYMCRTERPPLPVFTSWPDLDHTHKGFVFLCSYINGCATQTENNPLNKTYTSADLCCGGYCSNCPTDGTPIENFCGIEACAGPDRVCGIGDEVCPPFDTQAQIDCIGYTPDCTEP